MTHEELVSYAGICRLCSQPCCNCPDCKRYRGGVKDVCSLCSPQYPALSMSAPTELSEALEL